MIKIVIETMAKAMAKARTLRVAFWSLFLASALSVMLISTNNEAISLGIQKTPTPAPEFTHPNSTDWINSKPMRMKDFAGKVVLLDFWTFECWNCYKSFPWLRSVERRFHKKGLEVIGVHTPEFEHERDIDNVREKVKEFKLKHPVMIDNDFSYWRAMGNRYWPAFYIIDKRGYIRGIFVGETHVGDQRAKVIEGLIDILLAEK